MEVIGLALAIPPTIDLIITHGKDLALRIKATKSDNSLFGDVSAFEERGPFLAAQFEVGQQICALQWVNESVRDSLDATFVKIQTTLNEALKYVEEVETWSKKKRFWRAHEPRTKLATASNELDRLVRNFLNMVQLVRDREVLPAHVFLAGDVFAKVPGMPTIDVSPTVCISGGHLARQERGITPKRAQFLYEYRPYTAQTKQMIGQDVRSLTEGLASKRSPDAVLDVVGYLDNGPEERFEIVFDIPTGHQYQGTLQSVMQTTPAVPLNSRIEVCTRMADAILYITTLHLVHKRVSSANLVFWTPTDLTSPRENERLGRLSLINWRLVRKASSATTFEGDTVWFERLYQHPTRQFTLAEREYSMAHDIYSLGVCLLEVLLWEPLVVLTSHDQQQHQTPSLSPAFNAKMEEMYASGEIARTVDYHSDPENPLPSPREVQKVLRSYANQKLPFAVGERLATLVESCLAVLENGFGSWDIVQGDRVETALNYIAAVQDVLRELRI